MQLFGYHVSSDLSIQRRQTLNSHRNLDDIETHNDKGF